MGTKRKRTPLAEALLSIDQLGEEELKTVLDYIRGKQPKAPRKKKEKGPSRLPDNADSVLKDQKAS